MWLFILLLALEGIEPAVAQLSHSQEMKLDATLGIVAGMTGLFVLGVLGCIAWQIVGWMRRN